MTAFGSNQAKRNQPAFTSLPSRSARGNQKGKPPATNSAEQTCELFPLGSDFASGVPNFDDGGPSLTPRTMGVRERKTVPWAQLELGLLEPETLKSVPTTIVPIAGEGVGIAEEVGNVRVGARAFVIEGQTLSCEMLVQKHLGLVKMVVGSISTSLPVHVERDDLINEGIIGLFDAAEKFDDSKGFKFSTYAKPRIWGHITDHLRNIDWAPRTVRSRKRELEQAVHALEQELLRSPDDSEIASRMGISLKELAEIYSRIQRGVVVSLEEALPSDDSDDFHPTRAQDLVDRASDFTMEAENKDFKRFFLKKIDELPRQERTVFYLHYIDNKTLKAITKDLDLSESRVSQIHTKAVESLQTIFRRCSQELEMYGVTVQMIDEMTRSKRESRAKVAAVA